MIPGANVLNMALTLIAKQTVTYLQAEGRALNNIGQYVTTYAPPIPMLGSFQPVPKVLYNAYGLDLQKSYFTFYTSHNIIDLQRNVSNDQIVFGGQRYQCESNNEWFLVDGWKGVLCSLITATDEAGLTPVFGFGQPETSNGNTNFDNGDFEGAP